MLIAEERMPQSRPQAGFYDGGNAGFFDGGFFGSGGAVNPTPTIDVIRGAFNLMPYNRVTGGEDNGSEG